MPGATMDTGQQWTTIRGVTCICDAVFYKKTNYMSYVIYRLSHICETPTGHLFAKTGCSLHLDVLLKLVLPLSRISPVSSLRNDVQ